MEFELTYGRIRYEDVLERDGTVTRYVHVPGFIGNHGPFPERFTHAEYLQPGVVEARFNALRDRLRSLPK